MNKDLTKSGEVIRSSDPEWLNKALRHYTGKTMFELIDDAGLGLSQPDLRSAVGLLKALREKKKFSTRHLWQVLTGLGLGGVGIALIIAAILDPEPTSKLGILLAGGVLLIVTGGLSILKALGQTWVVRVGKGLFTVEPRNTP